MNSALGLASLLAIGLVAAVALGAWFVVRRLRRPPRRTTAWAISRSVASDPGELDAPRAFTEWSVGAPDGPLRGVACPVWDIAGDDPSGPVMVLTPGWGDSRVGALVRVAHLAPMCSRIAAWDSPGLGEAPGACPLGTREFAILRALIERIDGDRPVILFGWSLGAGTSIVAALANPRVAGVIAEAPYRQPWTPAFRVLEASGYPWRLNGPIAFALLGLRLGCGARWSGFDRALHATRLRAPLLVIHGDQDSICPLDDGRAIAESAANGRLRVIEGAGHNNLWTEDRFAHRCAWECAAFVRTITGNPGASGG